MHHATTLPVSEQTYNQRDDAILFVSLELSRSTWVATSLALGSKKMSKQMLVGRRDKGCGRIKVLPLIDVRRRRSAAYPRYT